MLHQNPSHSGYTADNTTSNSAQLLWTYTAGRMVQSSPAVAYGCVFVGSRGAQIFCLNETTGKPIWIYTVGYEVWSSPAIYNSSLYVGADDGYIYCINIMTGTPVWRTQIGIPVRSSPTVVDGVVYIGSQSNLYALNATNGNTIWDIQNFNPYYCSPAVSNGVLYIASNDGSVYAINASTGNKIWSSYVRTATTSSPAIYNGCVYIGSYDGYVFCLNATNGNRVWSYRTADEVESSPAIAYGCVYVGSEDNNVYCLNASTGSKIWQSPTGYWVTSSPAVAGGNVYVGSQDDDIYCFNATTGAKEWSYPTGNQIESSPAIANNTLFIGSDDGKLYALALTNSVGQSPLLQSSNLLPMTINTIVFDTIACIVGAAVIFTVAYYFYVTRLRSRSYGLNSASEQKGTWLQRHTDTVLIVGILAFSAIFFVNLGRGVLQAADEQTYSQWAYHMVKTGDYLTPWAYGAQSWIIGKPPMLMWLMSLAYQVFGVNNFAARIWSATFGALSLVLTYFLGKKLYNRYVGFTSAIVLGTFVTYYVFARYAMTDVPLVCFILASIYFFVLSEGKENTTRYAVFSGVFFGLALLTKQVAALLVPLTIFAYLLATKRSLRFLITKKFTLTWGVGLALFLPWVAYMGATFGSNFWQGYFIYADLSRTSGAVEGHVEGFFFYFNFLASSEFWLWIVLIPFAAGLCVFNALHRRSKPDALVFLWMMIVLLVFSLAQTKIYWYIMPVFPAFALAIASLLYQIAQKMYRSLYPKMHATKTSAKN